MKVERISGRDDLAYDVIIRDATGAAVTTGTVTMVLCAYGTATPLVSGGEAAAPLTHQSGGRWQGAHDDASIATAIADIPIGGLFDRVLMVEGRAARRLARCQRVAVVSER